MTHMRAAYRRVLETGLRGDFVAAQRLNTDIGDVPFADTALLTSATCYLAIRRKFGANTDDDAVQAFIDDTMASYANAQPPLDPAVVEAVVRMARGEPERMNDIRPAEAVPVQISVAYKIVTDLGLSHAALARLLDSAEELATGWAAAPPLNPVSRDEPRE
jgi:hypothetical protein